MEKNENIELLKRDLCARLPYGVWCEMDNGNSRIEDALHAGGLGMLMAGRWTMKPYLFPMSDVTEEVLLYGRRVRMMDRILGVLDLDGYGGQYTSWELEPIDDRFIVVKTFGEPSHLLEVESLVTFKKKSTAVEPTPWTYYTAVERLLLESHFDVNGLIPKQLAYAVTADSNPYMMPAYE